ncbi:FkbM family methyltransferase [Salinifilum aidingensis]
MSDADHAAESTVDASGSAPGAGQPDHRSAPRGNTGGASRELIGCTLARRDQLPAARVLRESFLQHHPAARFALLVVDRPDLVDPDEPDAVDVTELGLSAVEFARLATACTAEQLRAVLRPRLLRRLLGAAATVVCCEPEVRVLHPFDDVLAAEDRPVRLVPRVLRPLVADGLRPGPDDLAEAGMFDPHLLVAAPGAERALEEWQAQLDSDPAGAAPRVDGLAVLADHAVLRDPGLGLSAFNAAQRQLARGEENCTVDGAPLRSVHFTGFQPERPWLLSAAFADNPRVLLSEHPLLAELCAHYRNALVRHGYTAAAPHPYDHLPDGTPLPEPLRRDYLHAWRGQGDPPPSPFAPASGEEDPAAEFLRWAAEPADDRQRDAGGSRWTAAVWAADPVLRRDFPDPFGADAAAFHEWCLGTGHATGRVPGGTVRAPAGRQATLLDQLGVSVLGAGPLAELLAETARASGLPTSDTPCYPVVLRCRADAPVPAGRHVVDVALASEHPTAGAAEAWYLSEQARITARGTSGPASRVLPVPVPLREPIGLAARKGERARWELSDEFVVAAAVDHATEHADNALGLVNAFLSAFDDEPDARLLLLVAGAARHPEAAERLRLATASEPRVLLTEHPEADAVPYEAETTLAAADCVLALPRAEADRHVPGLVRLVARGVPVIAADAGGLGAVLGSAGAWLVPCSAGGAPEPERVVELLRAAAADREELAESGLRAREHARSQHAPADVGARLRERVEQAYRSWRSTWSEGSSGERTAQDPLRPLLVARHALHRAPDVAEGARGAMTPALRKAVLKVLGHYDEHLRDVLRSLVDGVEGTAAELLRRQERADGTDPEVLRVELARLARQQEQLAEQVLHADDAAVRTRTELAEQQRRLRAVEQQGTEDERWDAVAQRLDGLTGALERVVDRVDALEQRQTREQEWEPGVRAASLDAANALRRAEMVQRVVLRDHERAAEDEAASGAGTTPVLCDAGVLRLPADDTFLLPWLSQHATWDTEVSGLLDALVEPGSAFLDVGAYVGYQTVRMLNAHELGAAVAVEPSARAADLAHRNVAENVPKRMRERFALLAGAAWDGPAELIGWPGAVGGLDVQQEADGAPADVAEQVRALPLDAAWAARPELVGARDLRISAVHVDVAAQLHRVLAGMAELLTEHRPSVVCSFAPDGVARDGADPVAVLHGIAEHGYELVPVGREVAVGADDLLAAVRSSGAHTVKLWLRPE